MPSQQLDLWRRRVRDLDGKVAAVQRDIAQITAEETALAQRTGGRPGQGALMAQLVARASPVLPAGAGTLATAAGVLLTGLGRRDVQWDVSDRRWAGATGPKVRLMMSVLARLEQLGDAERHIDLAAFPEDERAEVEQLLARGNGLAREAARLHNNWVASPISVHDSANRGIGSRYFQLYVVRGNPFFFMRTVFNPRATESRQAERWAGTATTAAGLVARGAEQVLRTQTAGESLNRPGEQEEPPPESSPWATVAIVALVAAGGFLAYKIVRGKMGTPDEEAEEA